VALRLLPHKLNPLPGLPQRLLLVPLPLPVLLLLDALQPLLVPLRRLHPKPLPLLRLPDALLPGLLPLPECKYKPAYYLATL
jgi:hypothetical protein